MATKKQAIVLYFSVPNKPVTDEEISQLRSKDLKDLADAAKAAIEQMEEK